MADDSSIADELGKLADLRDRGVLTDKEFARQKELLLNGADPDSRDRTWDGSDDRLKPELREFQGLLASTMPVGAWIAIIGGGLSIIASFLPWVSATAFIVSISRNAFQLGAGNGFSPDGVILVLLGVISIVIGIARLTNSIIPRYIQRSPIVLGLGVAFVAINRLPSIIDLTNGPVNCSSCNASIGFGVYVTFVAAGLMIVGGLVLRSVTSLSVAHAGPPALLRVDAAWFCPLCWSEWNKDLPGSVCPDCGAQLQRVR